MQRDIQRGGDGLRFVWALLALLGLLPQPSRALAAPIRTEVAVDRFSPTQRSVGKASAMLHLAEWTADAAQRGMTLTRYAEEVLQPGLGGRVVPVVIDPQGRVLNTDAHHRIVALLALQARTGITLRLPTEVLADYRGKNEAAFAEDFTGRLRKGWFAPRLRGASAVVKLRSLPTSYGRLRDDPLRSSVDTAFEQLGLSGKQFSDYVEFKIGEALVKDGLYRQLRAHGLLQHGQRSIPEGHSFDTPIVTQIIELMRTPRLRRILDSNARTAADRTQIAAALDAR